MVSATLSLGLPAREHGPAPGETCLITASSPSLPRHREVSTDYMLDAGETKQGNSPQDLRLQLGRQAGDEKTLVRRPR